MPTRRNKQDNRSLFAKLKKRSHEQLLETSVHAVPYIIKSKRFFVRLFWITFLILSIVSCSFFVYKNLFDYLEYPIVTNINRIYERNPHFPKITICYFAIPYYWKYSFRCFLKNERCMDIIIENKYCLAINSGVGWYGQVLELTRSVNPGVSSPYLLEIYNPNVSKTFNVYINSQSEHYSLSEGIKVNVKSQIDLVINRDITNRLHKPYSNCIKELVFPDLGHNTSISRYRNKFPYHQTNCFELCKLEYIFERCDQLEAFQNISRFFYTDFTYFNGIYNDLISKCNDSLKIQLDVNSYFRNKGVAIVCGEMCPIECDSVEYSVKSFYLSFPYHYRTKSAVRIYYETFDYTSTTQIPKLRSDDLFGNVGGILGLFLGVSLLSLVEIIELLFSSIHIMMDHKY